MIFHLSGESKFLIALVHVLCFVVAEKSLATFLTNKR